MTLLADPGLVETDQRQETESPGFATRSSRRRVQASGPQLPLSEHSSPAAFVFPRELGDSGPGRGTGAITPVNGSHTDLCSAQGESTRSRARSPVSLLTRIGRRASASIAGGGSVYEVPVRVAPRIDWMLFLELCSLLHWPSLLPESIGCFFLNYAVFYIGRRFPQIDWMLFLELCSLLHWPSLLPESIGCFFLN